MFGIGHGHSDATDTRHRLIKVEDTALHELGADLGGEAAGAPTFIDDHSTMRPRHGSQNSRHIQRPQ